MAAGLLAGAVAQIGPPAVPALASTRPVDAGAVALAATVAVAVAVRRRHPIAALGVLDAISLVWFLGGYP